MGAGKNLSTTLRSWLDGFIGIYGYEGLLAVF